MKEYYGYDSPSSDFFAHYGVQGMKWGIRKALDEQKNKVRRARSAAYDRARNKLIVKASRAVASTLRDNSDSTGRYGRGNIDLNKRKVVRNRDGSISTERSFSVNLDGKETLLPTVVNGKIVSEDEAIDHYYKTGEHLGQFDSIDEAEEYAQKLHNRQDWYYNQKNQRMKHVK